MPPAKPLPDKVIMPLLCRVEDPEFACGEPAEAVEWAHLQHARNLILRLYAPERFRSEPSVKSAGENSGDR